ncbi:MAG: DUF805 domain-containing protein [Rhodoferax sp.]|nr:DUF805 domain-containing protein [Rhodoferax sp.]
MNFQQSIKLCFSKYADFNGRASRPEYWWFALFIFLASAVLSMVSNLLPGIFAVATLLPSLAVAVRRLHDTERSGWWLLVGLVPVVGFIVLIVFMTQKTVGVTLSAPQPY